MDVRSTDDDEASKSSPRLGVDSVLAIVSLILALGGLFFQPALPYTLNTPVSVVVFIALAASTSWLVIKVWQWRQAIHRCRPRGVWAASVTSLLLAATCVIITLPQEEMGYGSARCDFGLFGFGIGIVWIKVEPDDPGTMYDLTVTWGGWVGKPTPRKLHETTYFTLLKRDLNSSPADVTVTPDAKLTCGDGRPPQPSIHLDGDDWQPRRR
jgi:hypothetical protein